MKKLLSFLCLGSFVFTCVTAQNLKIIVPGGKNTLNDSTVTSLGLSNDVEFGPTFYVVNTTSNPMTVNVRRVVISAVTGTENEICWAGTCYGPGVNQSPNTETIGAHDTATLGNEFNGDYLPQGNVGTTVVHYIFFDVNNPTDTSGITVRYDATLTGVASIANNAIKFSAPYPNPANTFVTLNYGFTSSVQAANLKIFNLLGDCIQTIALDASKNKVGINVQAMPSGIYVCEVEASGCQPVYQKMIVSH